MSDAPLTDITGVILVGGKSRRMGRDKAFLELEGKPLVERLLSVFKECFSEIILVGDNGQRFSNYDVPVFTDIYPGSPLGGIYSGLYHSTNRSIFVASCDLAYPNSAVIQQICSLTNGYDAVVPVLSHGFETLCAVYSKNCLPAMQAMLEGGNHRIFDLYPQINVRSVPYAQLAIADKDGRAFLSVNTPDEFDAVKKQGRVIMNTITDKLQVRSKIWLEMDGEPVFGQGREILLRLVQKSGSINAASKEMGIPYRKAWTYIDAMEKRLGISLVNRLKGGSGGGESTLTPEALMLLEQFDTLQQGFQEFVDQKFQAMLDQLNVSGGKDDQHQ